VRVLRCVRSGLLRGRVLRLTDRDNDAADNSVSTNLLKIDPMGMSTAKRIVFVFVLEASLVGLFVGSFFGSFLG
jgi:hypothetical protein